jgi:hypothetical protein
MSIQNVPDAVRMLLEWLRGNTAPSRNWSQEEIARPSPPRTENDYG